MPIRAVVKRSHYADSMALMRLATQLRAAPGVRQAAALMGTPANRQLLAEAGLGTADVAAGPGDLIVAVDAESAAAAEALLAGLDDLLRATVATAGGETAVRPRTLDSAVRQLGGANLACISLPGYAAAREARRALRRGLSVFLFSDNVPLEDEVRLKRLAVERGLLCMGPDCGTAYLHGTGLGFANVVPRGRVGCVAASGTGLQAVAARLAALGEGVSHGVGVGGRDLSAEVGGVMTRAALEALAADADTEVIVLLSKPPAASVLPELARAIEAIDKPVVVWGIGAPGASRPGHRVQTLDDAAACAAALRHGRPWHPASLADVPDATARLARWRGRPEPGGGRLLGLFAGGTLATEARALLEPLVGPVGLGGDADPRGARHEILDLGADEFTVGRLHPMLDPSLRADRLAAAGDDPSVGVVLADVVLGRGAHPDPAGALAEGARAALAAARRDGRRLAVVASVIGTAGDPQGYAGQVAALEGAGVEVLPSSAQAARYAALCLDPSLARRLLEAA